MNMIQNVTQTQMIHRALKPMDKLVFVFGSNEAGIHGAGAAATAERLWGAIWGKGFGHHGNSFAIPTKDRRINTMPLSAIKPYVVHFLAYAQTSPDLHFMVTQIGCGLAGFDANQIAPLFKDAPPNCSFDTAWYPYLGDSVLYWGTYP